MEGLLHDGTGEITCASCFTEIETGVEHYYDENKEHHYCDYHCFLDWFADHLEEMASEYVKLNLYAEE